jgi:hypothetical protein
MNYAGELRQIANFDQTKMLCRNLMGKTQGKDCPGLNLTKSDVSGSSGGLFALRKIMGIPSAPEKLPHFQRKLAKHCVC